MRNLKMLSLIISCNDAGIIMAKVAGKKRPYALAVMTSACGRHKKLRKLVRLINKVHSDIARRSK